MTTDTTDTTTDESIENETDELALRQRARAEREFQQIRESDNPFAEVAADLRDQGESFEAIYQQYAAIEAALGDTSMASQTELIPEWKVAVKVPDDTPSGYRYEYHTQAVDNQQEAEQNVRDATGFEVAPEKTEQVGYVEVA